MRCIPKFHPLTGIYEPSAVQQLSDGRFLVAEDEKQQPFSLVTIDLNGEVTNLPLAPEPRANGNAFWKLGDLEGITLDASGNIYAITSHSRDREGDERKSRETLVRFRIEGDHAINVVVFRDLKSALIATHPVFAYSAAIRSVKDGSGFNIEALEISPDQQRLLVGFRSPLFDKHAVIACIENASAIFDANASPKISPTLEMLNLDGYGIRGLGYISSLQGYLIVSGPTGLEHAQFQLWFWSGHPGVAARRVTVPGFNDMAHAEGVCAAVIDGRQRVVIVSDDGNEEDSRYGHFLLLDPMQMQIASK